MSDENGISDRICRGCLSDAENDLMKIQSLNISSEMNSLLRFLNFEEFEIEMNFICGDCVSLLKKILDFKSQCELSKITLQKQANNCSTSNTQQNLNNDIHTYHSESDEDDSKLDTEVRNFESVAIKKETDLSFESDDQTYSNLVQYTCTVCERTFQKEQYFIRHKYFSHGETNNLFPCMVTYCPTICTSQNDLDNHRSERHVTICNICNKKFKTNLYLRRHKAKNHFSPKYTCKNCSKIFKHKDVLDRHISKQHSALIKEARQKICETCGKECTNLKRHMQAVHLNIKNFKCDYCDAKFLDNCKKISHEKIMHFNYKRFKCEYCAKSFAYKPQLINHIRIHTGEKPFVCSICSRAFAQARTLQLHRKIIHKIVIEKKRSTIIDDKQL
ncbi:zinc finger protein OZF-like [Chrysoperla carnea]|uniref:zinc finger protein OZF-like n=1 Tax=Chrysoperla carnea TaxID=189513 RepID=UPI001D092386|nr:zinc finger protein OZF-like [Chrysoperla carnea]